ncbi:DUF1016 N-terminal domain-containing protein [Mucilaginibacter sp.]|uniref:DUF1016 N-terminal domain-containing protein n=1 Tax=Mucilaginibacter sp. TaxID=1882438 RepID=UPI00262196B5|nr:DUF1016 N-terminal domain-containing protein [Mucilaginibacter sp.]
MKSFFYECPADFAKCQAKAYTAVNSAMVEAYWHIGKRIVEEEQQGGHSWAIDHLGSGIANS